MPLSQLSYIYRLIHFNNISNILFYDNSNLRNFVLLGLNKLTLYKPYVLHMEYIVRYKSSIIKSFFEMIYCPARK